MIKGSICPFQHLEKDFKSYKFSEQCISKAKLMNYEVCKMFEIAALFTLVRQVMFSPRSGKHVTRSLKHEAVKHVVEIPFRKKCRHRHRSVFEHWRVFSLPHEAPLRQRFYKMIRKLVQPMENKTKQRKWRMKAVKEKLQVRVHFRHVGMLKQEQMR